MITSKAAGVMGGPNNKKDKHGRSYEDKSSIEWKDEWLAFHDGYKDVIGDWARRHDSSSANCNWCKVLLYLMILH